MHPFKSGPGGGGNIKWEELGFPVPLGGSNIKKEFIRIPISKDIDNLAASANILPRGRLSKEVGALLALLNIIAPQDLGTKAFTAYIVAATMSEDGQAMTNLLMADTGMVAPAALSTIHSFSPDGHDRKSSKKSQVKEDNE